MPRKRNSWREFVPGGSGRFAWEVSACSLGTQEPLLRLLSCLTPRHRGICLDLGLQHEISPPMVAESPA